MLSFLTSLVCRYAKCIHIRRNQMFLSPRLRAVSHGGHHCNNLRTGENKKDGSLRGAKNQFLNSATDNLPSWFKSAVLKHSKAVTDAKSSGDSTATPMEFMTDMTFGVRTTLKTDVKNLNISSMLITPSPFSSNTSNTACILSSSVPVQRRD